MPHCSVMFKCSVWPVQAAICVVGVWVFVPAKSPKTGAVCAMQAKFYVVSMWARTCAGILHCRRGYCLRKDAVLSVCHFCHKCQPRALPALPC